MNLNISIYICGIEKLESAIETIKKLELENSPEINTEVTIELTEE